MNFFTPAEVAKNYIATPAPTRIPPIRLPMYTITQFFSIWLTVISFSRSGIVNRQFPVNSSLQAIRTIVSPPGNTQAPMNLPRDGSVMDTATVVAPTPPNPINAPARIARMIIFGIGVLTLLFPVAM